jgi:serine/threonine protein phosphatase PrpC
MDKVSDRLIAGDRFLLCSDGLCKTLPADELAQLLGSDAGVPPPQALVAAALSMNATDNVTAVTVEVGYARYKLAERLATDAMQ